MTTELSALKPKRVMPYPEPDGGPVVAASRFNREEWLTRLAAQIAPLFKGFTVGPYRVTCGWPSRSALSRKAPVIGQCFYPRVLKDDTKEGYHEIFISPVLEDSIEVAGTLAHEMVHVVAGQKAGHTKVFVEVGRHIGLTKGKPTSLGPGDELVERLRDMVDKLGAYPHRKILPRLKEKPPGTKEIPLVCMLCGCGVRISDKWLAEAGLPVCACGQQFVVKPRREKAGSTE